MLHRSFPVPEQLLVFILSSQLMPSPAPLAFSPSERWDGQNGQWSTFIVRIGQPEQNFRVLPSAATGAVFVPDVTGCQSRDGNSANCASTRGVVNSTQSLGFQTNASSSWNPVGSFQTSIGMELGYNASASFGRDSVGLKSTNSGGPKLTDQIVGSLLQQQPFYRGYFGLSPKPINFTDFNNPHPSVMASLKNSSQVPSMSYGYTAVAYYRKMLGSLTLGGYDESRFPRNNNITISFGPKNERPTSLNLQSVTARNTLDGTLSLLKREIYVSLDFTMLYLWLPVETCDLIASTFKLDHDAKNNMYLVGDQAHAQLVASNPSFTFEFSKDHIPGKAPNPAETISITVPYAAFDLVGSWSAYNGTKKYFPIRQGNESQYTLGRAFMQEAYIIADYERRVYSLQQASTFPASEQRIVAIPATNAGVVVGDGEKARLNRASIAGISIGATASMVVLLIATMILLRRKRQSGRADEVGGDEQSESHVAEKSIDLSGQESFQQLMSVDVSELDPTGCRAELPIGTHELCGET